MDQESFDRIARLLGGAISRRRGFGVGAALAALAGGAIAPSAEAKRERGEGRAPGATSHKPKPAGPCGSGKVADNKCARDADCCTNICKLKNKGKDGKGRCRCQRKNKPCTEDINCCSAAGQQMICISGHCGFGAPAPVPTGSPCDVDVDTCAEAAASCVEYESGTPSGTYCLLPNGAACSGNAVCESDSCASGICATTCTVCASGCPYTTITGAFDNLPSGSVISIAPGKYDETVEMDSTAAKDNMTFRRCGSAGRVQWTSTSGSPSYVFRIDGAYSATLTSLEFYGKDGNPSYALVSVAGDYNSTPKVRGTLTATDCILRDYFDSDSYSAMQLYWADVTVNGCTFKNNYSYEGGGAIIAEGYGDSYRSQLTINNSLFDHNQAGDSYPGTPTYEGGAVYLYRTNATINGSTFINNGGSMGGAIYANTSVNLTIANTLIDSNLTAADGAGGGILLEPGSSTAGEDVNVTLTGTTKVTGNTADYGSGIAVLSADPTYLWSITGAPGRVSNNVGATNQCAITTNDGTTWTGVPNCVF